MSTFDNDGTAGKANFWVQPCYPPLWPIQPTITTIWPTTIPQPRAPIRRRHNRAPIRRKGRGAKETYIALILDKSGSMTSCYDAALGAINEQIDTIKANAKKGGRTYVSIILFSSTVDIIAENVLAENLKHLTREDYVLDGMTALRDAVRTAIELMQEFEHASKNQGFLTVLISDGQENQSGTSKTELQNLIALKERTDKWSFTYMLDGHSWEQIQELTNYMGSSISNYGIFSNTPAGTQKAGLVACNALSSYMSARNDGQTSTKTFYNDQNNKTE